MMMKKLTLFIKRWRKKTDLKYNIKPKKCLKTISKTGKTHIKVKGTDISADVVYFEEKDILENRELYKENKPTHDHCLFSFVHLGKGEERVTVGCFGDVSYRVQETLFNELKNNPEKFGLAKEDYECVFIIVMHHGSNYNQNEHFITLINPVLGVIQAEKSDFEHPTSETLDLYERMGISLINAANGNEISYQYSQGDIFINSEDMKKLFNSEKNEEIECLADLLKNKKEELNNQMKKTDK